MKGYIYKITNADESIVYVGSTTLTIEQRWREHMIAFSRWNEGNIRCAAMIYHHFHEHGIDAFGIRLISELEIEDRKSILQFEQLVIDSTSCVNKQAPWKSAEDKHVSKQKYSLEYNKIHNRELVQRECGETYTRGHKARHERTERHRYGIASEEERKHIDKTSCAKIAENDELGGAGLLFYCPPSKQFCEVRDLVTRLVIPETLQDDVLHHYHTSPEGGHQGESPGNLQATYPLQIIAMDHIPSLPKSYKGNTKLLIWIDIFTDYVIPKASASRTAQTIAENYE
ncbi:unnamed protein product [Phytophthora fragariaefolia]|uniref:Unnamed protein product n=1 Tax=Phytophthora fragariaefolia TaxID=1490495 RepID=A0A9W6YA49_9STRA|nr:unnamed protein product [Phytophthora fragariaefolia]